MSVLEVNLHKIRGVTSTRMFTAPFVPPLLLQFLTLNELPCLRRVSRSVHRFTSGRLPWECLVARRRGWDMLDFRCARVLTAILKVPRASLRAVGHVQIELNPIALPGWLDAVALMPELRKLEIMDSSRRFSEGDVKLGNDSEVAATYRPWALAEWCPILESFVVRGFTPPARLSLPATITNIFVRWFHESKESRPVDVSQAPLLRVLDCARPDAVRGLETCENMEDVTLTVSATLTPALAVLWREKLHSLRLTHCEANLTLIADLDVLTTLGLFWCWHPASAAQEEAPYHWPTLRVLELKSGGLVRGTRITTASFRHARHLTRLVTTLDDLSDDCLECIRSSRLELRHLELNPWTNDAKISGQFITWGLPVLGTLRIEGFTNFVLPSPLAVHCPRLTDLGVRPSGEFLLPPNIKRLSLLNLDKPPDVGWLAHQSTLIYLFIGKARNSAGWPASWAFFGLPVTVLLTLRELRIEACTHFTFLALAERVLCERRRQGQVVPSCRWVSQPTGVEWKQSLEDAGGEGRMDTWLEGRVASLRALAGPGVALDLSRRYSSELELCMRNMDSDSEVKLDDRRH